MNPKAQKYYQTGLDTGKNSVFSKVIVIDQNFSSGYEEVIKIAPSCPRPWFELARISVSDRLDFFRVFWLNTMPYNPKFHDFIVHVFENLEDISLVLCEEKKTAVFTSELVYSLKKDQSFFKGLPPSSVEMIAEVNNEFENLLPKDFLAFLKIHNGFAKNEEPGIIQAEDLKFYKQRVDQLILEKKGVKSGKDFLDPLSLIPFYQCCETNCFQCFYNDWYPHSEMGNVYYDGLDSSISNLSPSENFSENLAFETFSDWLVFYLEEIEVSF